VGEIRAQVAAVLTHDARAPVIGIFSSRPQDWPEELAVGDRRFALRWCESPLSVRLALREARTVTAAGTIILTPLADADLGADVLARLSRGRVFRVKHWDIVQAAFQARAIEARLGEYVWMGDLLIERMPPRGYAPAPSGVLDAETAWRSLLQVTLGLESARPDIESLLLWTTQPESMPRWLALSDKARAGIADWLESVTGPAGHLVLGVVAAGFGVDALPLGLVADVLFTEESASAELAAATVRLERFSSGRRLDQTGGKRWAEAAGRVVRALDGEHARPFLARADQLIADLHVSKFAGLSSVLPSGFEARLTEYCERLRQFVAGPNEEALLRLEDSAARVRTHAHARVSTAREERVDMATRLARWMIVTPPKLAGLDAHVADYAAGGAFIDWARFKLLGGDQIADLSAAFGALAEKVRERREAMNRSFAESLKVWSETGSTSGVAVPVERVLESVLAPLAEAAPVLLLVVDGLSVPVFLELAADLGKLGWTPLARETGSWIGAAIAALPTVTEISRASLLAGRLASGAQQAEKTAFAQHAALVARSRPGTPTLFHKGELSEGLGLAAGVREAVGGRDTRVVGVVYNAIDDQLDGATQISLRWTLDDLRMLPALLHEARGAGRVVVLTADHGHVIEHQTAQRSGGEGDRWRRPDGSLHDGEIVIERGRVLTPGGGTSVAVPWSERIRYGGKKNGYHGGVSVQEVVVPLCVLAPTGMIVPGWRPMPPLYPEWWQAVPSVPVAAVAAPPPVPVPSRKAPTPQPDLFSAPRAAPTGDWVSDLLQSAAYKTQKALAARVAPQDDDMRRLLEALAERGGKLSKGAVAARLSLPTLRVGGFLSAARRVLNIDQSTVLTVDEASGTVELNRSLLELQFEIGRK